jgi:hypothetical protein
MEAAPMRTVRLATPQSDSLLGQLTALRLALQAVVAQDAAEERYTPELRACLALAEAVEETALRVLTDTVPA